MSLCRIWEVSAVPFAHSFSQFRFRCLGILTIVVLLVLCFPASSNAHWVISYECSGSTQLIVNDRNYPPGTVYEVRRETFPWPTTAYDGEYWPMGTIRTRFPRRAMFRFLLPCSFPGTTVM